jgi:hypothetical protein
MSKTIQQKAQAIVFAPYVLLSALILWPKSIGYRIGKWAMKGDARGLAMFAEVTGILASMLWTLFWLYLLFKAVRP